MDYSKAFGFIFQEDKWAGKFIIGIVMMGLSVFILPAPFFVGYISRILRNSSRRGSNVLPEWTGWSSLYREGLMFLLVVFIYVVLHSVASQAVKIFPFWRIAGWGIDFVFWLFLPVSLLYYVNMGDLRKALDPTGIAIFVRQNFVGLVVLWLLKWALTVIAFTGVVILFVGVMVTGLYTILVLTYLYGSLYRTYIKNKRSFLTSQGPKASMKSAGKNGGKQKTAWKKPKRKS